MTTLKDLSDLSTVINHIKNTINTAGYARFNKETLAKMRSTLAKLEQQFIDGVVALNTDVSVADVHSRIKEARQELSVKKTVPVATAAAVVVTPAGVESVALESNAPQAPPVVEASAEDEGEEKREETSDDTGLASLAARLAEEKRKLSSRRKTVGEAKVEKDS